MASRPTSLRLLTRQAVAGPCSTSTSSAAPSSLLRSSALASSSSSSSRLPAFSSSRSFSLSPGRRAEADSDEDPDADAPAKPSPIKNWLGITNERLLQWFKGEEGSRFKWPKEGAHNWIGGDRPYTANPYFTPTPPLSADLQDEMYAVYASFPAKVTAVERVNLISERYGIGKDRVTAVVKTGQLGELWKEVGIAPQNAFVRGMESVLVVPQHKPGNSAALAAFPTYLGSRIDLERDVETARLARGEITARLEDDAFGSNEQARRLGLLSWEFSAEGEVPLATKMQLEKPLRPPRALPQYPAKLIAEGQSQAVDHIVDVGDKFRDQGWDGRLGREFSQKASGQGFPGKQNAIRKFVPTLIRSVRAQAGVEVSSKRAKERARVAARDALNAQGLLTPTQQVLVKSHPGQQWDPTFVHKVTRNERVYTAKIAARERKVKRKSEARKRDLVNAKAEFAQMIRDRISGKI